MSSFSWNSHKVVPSFTAHIIIKALQKIQIFQGTGLLSKIPLFNFVAVTAVMQLIWALVLHAEGRIMGINMYKLRVYKSFELDTKLITIKNYFAKCLIFRDNLQTVFLWKQMNSCSSNEIKQILYNKQVLD